MAAPLAGNRIHNVDCVAGMQRLQAGSVHLAFADPPFNIGYDYDVYDDRREREHYLEWSKEWIAGVKRVLAPTGAFWLAIGDEYAAELKIISQDLGFHCRSWVVWYYTFGVNCKKKFTRSHAHMFHFVNDPEQFTFHDSVVRIPSARMLVYGDARANPKGRLPDDTWILRPQDCVDGFTSEEDTWYFPRVAGTFKERAGFHGCQMPEQLLGRIIRTCSSDGERVLDPFAGSGTTLVVAKKLGREFIGFELSEDYAQRGQARIEAIEPGDALVGAAEPLLSAPATASYTPPANGKGKAKLKAPKVKQEDAETPAARIAAPVINGGAPSRAALVEAFCQTNHGYSADRVVADPELNRAFLAACRKLGLVGSGAELNRALFRARKAGALAHVITERRTEYDWPAFDKFLFASEMAWRQMQDAGVASLDDLLCDPEQATRFDRLAANWAPGIKPLEYRWGALKLRKEAKTARERAAGQRPPKLSDAAAFLALKFEKLAPAPAVYLVSDGDEAAVYAGFTLNLRERLRRHLSGPARETWQRLGDKLTLRYALMPATVNATDGEHAATARHLLAQQFALRKKFEPTLNVAASPAAALS